MDQRAVLAVTVVSVISVAILVWLWEKKEKKKPDGPSPPDPPPSPPTPSIPLRPIDQKPLVPVNSPLLPVNPLPPLLPLNTSIKRISLGNPMTNFASVAQIVPHGLASLSDVEKYFGASAPSLTGWVAEGFVRAGAVVSPCAYGNECVDQSAFAFIDVRKPRAGRVEIYFSNARSAVIALKENAANAVDWLPVADLGHAQSRTQPLVAVPLNDSGLMNLVRADGTMVASPSSVAATPRQVAASLQKNKGFSIAAHHYNPQNNTLQWANGNTYWFASQDNDIRLQSSVKYATPFSVVFDVDAGGRGDLAQVPPVFPVAPTYL